jgi:hypothetical protein
MQKILDIFFKRMLVMGILLFSGQADFAQKKSGRIVVVDNKIYTKVDQMPEFPGGPDGWRRLLEKSIEYSDKEFEDGNYPGPVRFSFVVEKNGNTSNLTMIGRSINLYNKTDSSIHKMLEKTKWKPGKSNGKIVRVQMIQSIITCFQ